VTGTGTNWPFTAPNTVVGGILVSGSVSAPIIAASSGTSLVLGKVVTIAALSAFTIYYSSASTGHGSSAAGDLAVTGVVAVTNSTTSSSTTTGAVIVTGGQGVGGNLWVGGTTNIAGVTSLTSGTTSSSKTTGALVVTGGVGVSGALYTASNTLDDGTGKVTIGGTTVNPSADNNTTLGSTTNRWANINSLGVNLYNGSSALQITSGTLAASRTVTIPDPLTSAEVLLGSTASNTVNQATSITTGVTLSTISGIIKTVSSTLATGAVATFTVTNTIVKATSTILVSAQYAASGSNGNVNVQVNTISAGSFAVTVSNCASGVGNALNTNIFVHFLVIP